MNAESLMLRGKKPITKDHILYDSLDAKCPRSAKAQRRKVVLWLPRTGGGLGVRGGVLIWVMKGFKINCGDVRTTLGT